MRGLLIVTAPDLDDDKARLQVDCIHEWLSGSYWSPGVSRDLVERAIAGSHCLGAYRGDEQVGYARMISDRATFGWIADVYIADTARGMGIGRAMVGWFLAYPDYRDLRRTALVTLDAHGVYAPLGFRALMRPQNYMERLSPGAIAVLESYS